MNIVQLTVTSETEETEEYYHSECHELPLDPDRIDEVNRGILSVMGFRLFYGLRVLPAWGDKGTVVEVAETWELLRKGRLTKGDIRSLIDMGFTHIWRATFASPRFEVDGTEYHFPENNLDLSPVETLREAARWVRALG